MSYQGEDPFPTYIITMLDGYLNTQVSSAYKEQPLAQDWARLSKIGEELGEAIAAFIGVTGQNPRKGFHGSENDVNDELCDVIVTAILCLMHRTRDPFIVRRLLATRWLYRMDTAGLS